MGDLHAILDKIEVDIPQITKKVTEYGSSNMDRWVSVTNLPEFFQYFPFYCRLNSTGNDFFRGKTKI